MKRINLFAAVTAICFIFLSSCNNEKDNLLPTDSASKNEKSSANQGDLKPYPSIPNTSEKQYRHLVERAARIVEPTPCDANTPVYLWFLQQVAGWGLDLLDKAADVSLINLPTYYALYFETSSTEQIFGSKGEYTKQLNKSFKDLNRFWDIKSNNINMVAMHGSMVQDRKKVIDTYKIAFGLSDAEAKNKANQLSTLLGTYPELLNGNHPLLTYNSFAHMKHYYPGFGQVPDKIIMGDGLLQAYASTGFGDIAPQAILAHEYGHQIQFDLGIFDHDTQPSPEVSRRIELMADAYAAYFLSHPRGASMQWRRIQNFFDVFFNVGDCDFEADGHHGTPTQRKAAAEWGYHQANDAHKKGHIISIQKFAKLFDAELPNIITK